MPLARHAATAAVTLAALAASAPAALALLPINPTAPGAPAQSAPTAPIDPGTPTAPVTSAPSAPGIPSAPHGPSSLVLTVTTANRSLTAAAATPRTVTLRCDPAGGPQPYARAACSELDAASGGFDHIATTRRMCPMIFAPVTATATGTWQGHPVNWSRQYANSCVLAQHTGDVFSF